MMDETPVAAVSITPEFESILRYLRTLAEPCAPPMGAGGFDVLYASAREVVVWYSPARDGQMAREVAIPAEVLAVAWQSLCAGALLDEAALLALGLGSAGAHWVIALLAQIPGVQVRQEPLALARTSPPALLLEGEGRQSVANRRNGRLCPPLQGEGGRRPGEVRAD